VVEQLLGKRSGSELWLPPTQDRTAKAGEMNGRWKPLIHISNWTPKVTRCLKARFTPLSSAKGRIRVYLSPEWLQTHALTVQDPRRDNAHLQHGYTAGYQLPTCRLLGFVDIRVRGGRT